GFIGMNLCQRLVDLGADVTILDYFDPPGVATGQRGLRARLKLAIADMLDEEKVERLVRDQEVIFNLAGKSGAAESNKAPLNDLDINCRAHLTLLEACRRVNPSVTIVFPSSRLVYGKPHYLPVDERHPVAPESIYAAHKLVVENYHKIYGHLHGIKTTVLRISNPYGPMQLGDSRVYGIANRFIQTAVSGGAITLFGDGSQQRDYLYIDDLVDAFLRAAWSPVARGKTYNIGDSHGVTLLQLAKSAIEGAGKGEILMAPWPEEYLLIETGDYCTDSRLAEEELGWKPVTDLVTAVNQTVTYYAGLCTPHGSQ
ncbi:MAG TPA: NAD-dependent epimerase/dehydratase family protein, partial [Geobacterales bacterium]|nr:NAD-dependent epimerase/dehydratase family protein [Geobacterales bacterium]